MVVRLPFLVPDEVADAAHRNLRGHIPERVELPAYPVRAVPHVCKADEGLPRSGVHHWNTASNPGSPPFVPRSGGQRCPHVPWTPEAK